MPIKEKKQINKQYWEKLLQDFSTSSKLWLDGFDVTNIADNTAANYANKKISIENSLKKAIQGFSKKNDISMSAIIHSAWAILLDRFSGNDDILYGTASLSSYTKAAVKIQLPIIPVRSTVTEKSRLLSYLKHQQNELEKNHTYAETLNHIKLNTSLRYLLLNVKKIKSNKTKPITLNSDDITLILVVHNEKSLDLEYLYNDKKFNRESLASLAEHLILILQDIIQFPKHHVSNLPILTSNEEENIYKKWCHPYSYPIEDTAGVHQLIKKYTEKTPNAIAITSHDNTLTYKELAQLSNQLAKKLLSEGIQPNDCVTVLIERSYATIVCMLAIFKIGAVYVPINPKYPDDRIQYIINNCNAAAIIANETDRVSEINKKIIIIDDQLSQIKSFPQDDISIPVSSEQIAYIVYTSGTTGQPKGVMIKHISLINLTYWYKNCFNINENDRASQFASQGFDAYFCETVPILALGGSVHIIDDNTKLTPNLFIAWLAEKQITVCDLTTAYAQTLFLLLWPEKINLRLMKIGGELLSHYPTQQFSFDIWNIYGPTEATIEATYMKIYEANVAPALQTCKHYPPPIGKPLANAEAYIVDQHNQLVPPGIAGELLIGGLCVSPGYINREALTKERFIANPFNPKSTSKLYRTGDLARWLSDGNIEFVGRVDNQIKIRGYRIELSEIETTLNQYPDVNEVVVLAKEIVSGQKTLIAYLVPNLEKIRIPFQERCLLEINETRYLELLTEDISKNGMAITGITEKLSIGQSLRINLKLPGLNEGRWLTGRFIWQQGLRGGIKFDDIPEQLALIVKSVEYFLTTHNLMEVVRSAATKRNLRKALKKKLPDYMVPAVFSILPEFPLTFNGKIDLTALPPPQDFERMVERNYVEPRNDTEKDLKTIWESLLHQKHISITDNFFDLGGNSLLVSKLSVKILEHFHIAIPAQIFFDLPFILVQAEYIASKGKRYTHKTTIQDDIYRDAILNENITSIHKNSAAYKNPKGILLTGAGGFFGVYLLKELLKHTEATIYCLIRKGDFSTGAKRLMSNVEHFELQNDISLANRRIIVIASDIGFDRFGIPKEQYNSLAEKVDTIYHCGAQVNTMASYTTLRNSNVQGTLEIIKFATYKKDKCIHYISTLSSAYIKNEEGDFTEDFPTGEDPGLTGGYAISKWVSERLLTQLGERGVPSSIYRSGYILGQTNNGVTSLNDALLFLIKGCIQLKYAPDWHENITILPVDFVSEATVKISLHHPEKSDVFHIDHPKGILWIDLIRWLKNYGYAITICSHQEWRNHLMKITNENALFPFLPNYLAQDNFIASPKTDMTHAMNTLNDLGIIYPEIDDRLLSTYMSYFIRVGFLPPP
jgi:amino acid adenylation domain-containing protein/thioester reductase-like protein